MLANDIILRLVEMLMVEKDKNCELKIAQLEHNKQVNEVTSKD